MAHKINEWVSGLIRVELVRGSSAEFINQALKENINISDLHWTSTNQLQFSISVEHFFRIRKILKPLDGKIRIISKTGFPFFLRLIIKRVWFSIGLALFFIGIGLLSTFVWSIEVQGNETIPTKVVLEAAKNNGLFPLQSSFKMPDKDKLAKQLANDIDGVNWIGIEHTGTKVVIKVVEMTLPDAKDPKSYQHLVASQDAVITYMVANTGKPLVKEHMKVRKGDILISGIIGSEQHSEIVVAEGEVRGLVWYEYKAEIPLLHTMSSYTGEFMKKNYVVIGKRIFKLKQKDNHFTSSEVVQQYKPAKVFNYTLPFGTMKEIESETRIIEQRLTKEEASKKALEQAKQRLLEKAGYDAKVVSENILHEELHNGKVVIRVLFEVEQSIAQQKPIVQIQGD